ncbi:MAG: NAD(P)-dependent alcohol dehydrogenase [Archangium sp.]
MNSVNAWGAVAAGKPLEPITIERREPGLNDVELEVLFCGVCHSDIHQARDEWSGAKFPMVPGHEVIGRVTRVGRDVSKFAVGELAGIGCMVDSCRVCGPCEDDLEQFCAAGNAATYNSTEMDRKTPTYGGYSSSIVVNEHFALRIPKELEPAAAAPLLCAGITTYSPLKQFGVKAGDKVGVVGLGGLGHMAVKLAASMGAKVTVLSTTPEKEADARRLGATGFIATKVTPLSTVKERFDLLIDTVSATHDYDAYLSLLKPRGTMALVGAPPEGQQFKPFSLIMGGRTLMGSLIGGIAETQEMLDHCAKHGVVSDVEVIPIQQINEAYERVLKSDVRYRFVIDMKSLLIA